VFQRSYQKATAIFVLITVLAKIIFQPMDFNWLTSSSVVPGWHTTILPPNGIVHLMYISAFLILIGLLNLIYSKINNL